MSAIKSVIIINMATITRHIIIAVSNSTADNAMINRVDAQRWTQPLYPEIQPLDMQKPFN